MRSGGIIAAIVAAVALSIYGVSRLGPDMACHGAPDPECLLSIATDTARLIDKPIPHVQALIVIASAEAAAGHADRAAATIAEARRIADGPGLVDLETPPEYKYGGETGVNARAVLYDDIIDAQARMGASRTALADTAEGGESPDTRAMLFLSAAEVLFDFDRLDEARAFTDHAAAEMENIDQTESRADRTREASRLLTRMGDFAGAIAFVERSGMDAWDHALALVNIAVMQNHRGDQAGATATLDLAERKAIEIDGEGSRGMMHSIISDERPRRRTTEEMPSASHGNANSAANEPNDYTAANEPVDYTAEIEAAAALDNPVARDMALVTISHGQAHHGDLDRALNTMRGIEDRTAWSGVFNTVSFMFAQDGNAEGVWAAAREIPDDESRDLTLARDALVLVMAGNPPGGATMARNISNMATRATAYATIAWEMAEPTTAYGEGARGPKSEGKAE